MVATSRSTGRLFGTRRFKITGTLVLSLIVGIPAIGLFCLQWASDTLVPYLSRGTSRTQPSLTPRHGMDLHANLQTEETSEMAARGFSARSSPFLAQTRQAMIPATADPFYEAFSAGISEGVLVLQSTGGGVPTYGAPRSERRSAPVSDQALLREIRIELAGSFESFLDNVFSGAASRGNVPATIRPEQNPFASLADATQSDQTGTKDEASSPKQETGSDAAAKPKQDASPGDDPKTTGDAAGKPAAEDSQPVFLPGPFGIRANPSNPLKVVRPHVLMHVDKDGTLQAFAATQIREQTFETAEMGARQFNLLSFARPAETATAVAAANLNGDGFPDVCFLDSHAGLLRFYYGTAGGAFVEGMKIDVGIGPKSIAAGDFNRDGRADVAISNVGIGTLILLYLADPGSPPAFKSAWLDSYRDAIVTADTTGSGVIDLVGISFPSLAQVLDVGRAGGAAPGKTFTCSPAFERKVSTLFGYQLLLSATLLKSSLAVNLQNYQNQMVNIVNVQAGADIFVIVGDLNNENAISVALATLRK